IQYFSEDKVLFAFLRYHNHWIYEQVQDYAQKHIPSIPEEEVDLEGLFGGCIHISTSDEDLDEIQMIVEKAPEAVISHMEIRELNAVLNYGKLEPAVEKYDTTTVVTTFSLITNNSGGDIFIMITTRPY